MLVADIITEPERTRLLEAEHRGCRVRTGLRMLAGQVDEVITFLGLNQGSPAVF